jgi:hypothetical protein
MGASTKSVRTTGQQICALRSTIWLMKTQNERARDLNHRGKRPRIKFSVIVNPICQLSIDDVSMVLPDTCHIVAINPNIIVTPMRNDNFPIGELIGINMTC